MLKDVKGKYDISDELIYSVDETEIQIGIGVTEQIIGSMGAKIQHQQQSETWKNIIILPTICADRTLLASTIIYKEEAFQMKWL